MKQFETLLTAAGLPADKVAELSAIPADQWDAFKADDYVSLLRTGAETALKNDPTFWEGLDESNINEGLKKRIEASQFGRAAGIAKQKVLKGFGMTEADLADLSEEEKAKFEIVIAKATDKFVSSKVGDKELQKQLVDTRKRLEDVELDIPVREGKIKDQYEASLKSDKIDFIVLAEIAAIPGLKVPASYVADKISAELKAEFDFDVKGLKADPLQKGKNLKVIEGSKELSLRDLAIQKLTRDGLIDAVKQKQEPVTGKVIIEPKDGKLGVSSHVAAAIAANSK